MSHETQRERGKGPDLQVEERHRVRHDDAGHNDLRAEHVVLREGEDAQGREDRGKRKRMDPGNKKKRESGDRNLTERERPAHQGRMMVWSKKASK